MDREAIHAKLRAEFGDVIGDLDAEGVDRACAVPADQTAAVAKYLRGDPELQCDALMCLSGSDDGTLLSVTYHLYSYAHRHKFTFRVVLENRETPETESVVSVWPTADWQEREAYDMFGIVFTGHPDRRRILCPEDWEGWPLRKDYKVQEFYHGLRVPYPEDQDLDRGHWVFQERKDSALNPPHRPEVDWNTR